MRTCFLPKLQYSWIAAAGATVAAGTAIIGGISKRKAAKKELKRLGKSPDYQIPNELVADALKAEQRANVGLPSQQYNQAQQNIQRANNNAIKQATDRRSGLMAISASQQAANDARLGLDVADAKARADNQRTAYAMNAQLAAARDRKWGAAKDVYDRDYNYAMSLKGAGGEQIQNGIQQGIGAAAMGVSGGMANRSGGSGLYGGGRRSSSKGLTTSRYYNGYTPSSNYSEFQTEFTD